MTRLMRYMMVAAAAAVAAPSFASAAPMTPAEQTDYKSRERHDSRDVQTGNYKPHGTLTTGQRDSFAKQPRERGTPQTSSDANQAPQLHKIY